MNFLFSLRSSLFALPSSLFLSRFASLSAFFTSLSFLHRKSFADHFIDIFVIVAPVAKDFLSTLTAMRSVRTRKSSKVLFAKVFYHIATSLSISLHLELSFSSHTLFFAWEIICKSLRPSASVTTDSELREISCMTMRKVRTKNRCQIIAEAFMSTRRM